MRSIPALLILVFLSVQLEAADPPARPKLISLYPLGGQAGETLKVELVGKFLDPLQVAWFYCDQVEAEVLKLERTEEAKKSGADQENGSETKPYQGKYKALLKVRIAPDAELGAHYFRAVTPGGISNPMRFRITSEPNVREIDARHNELDTAQPIDSFPSVVQGSLPELGEVDYYRLQATQDQVLCFQVDFFSSTAPLGLWTMRPKLSIHEREAVGSIPTVIIGWSSMTPCSIGRPWPTNFPGTANSFLPSRKSPERSACSKIPATS